MEFKYSDYLITPGDLLRWTLYSLKNLHWIDVVGEAVIFFILIFTKRYLGWHLDSGIFPAMLFALFFWNLDARIFVGLAIVSLALCPLFLILFNNYNLIMAEVWARQAGAWAFYFLSFGIIKQIWDLRGNKSKEKKTDTGRSDEPSLSLPKPETGEGNKPMRTFSSIRYRNKRISAPVSSEERYLPHMVFLAVTLAIMIPLFFQHGFVFLLDMVWGPNLQLSDYLADGIHANFFLMLIFKALSLVLPVVLIQKILLSLVLFLCGFWMFTLAKHLMPRRWALLAGIIYLLNPYVFERFLAGHWMVLLGYAYFPLIVMLFLALLKNTRRKEAIRFALAFAIYPALNLHWAYIAFWFLIGLFLVYAVKILIMNNSGGKTLLPAKRKIFSYILLQIVLLIVFNSFWLWDAFRSSSILAKITPNDFLAFQTRTDPAWGIYLNVLALYGFWQDAFLLPKDIFAYWWLVAVIFVCGAFIGLFHYAKKCDVLALASGIAFIPALWIAVGYGSDFTSQLCNLLFRFLPGFKGLRETEKVAGVLAFIYAIYFPLGIEATMDLIWKSKSNKIRDTAASLVLITALFLVYLSVNNIFYGFGGQIKSYEYPPSWHEVESMLDSDSGTQKVLFLPWHSYMELSFANNASVANPAQAFFNRDIISSKSLDNIYLPESTQGDWDTKLNALIQDKESLDDDLGFFKSRKVSYIILAKTYDFENYGFLSESKIIQKISETDEIVLYKIP